MSATIAEQQELPRSSRLGWIEAGRAFAALAVVLFHSDTILNAYFPATKAEPLFQIGERGVDFFFVLSGFIIAHVHGGDIGRPGRTRRFALKRMLRIYPLLLFVAGGAILLNILFDHQSYSYEQLWTSLTLWPSLVWPTPSVTWTLRHEVMFYALFGACIASRRLGVFVVTAWLLMTGLQTTLLAVGTSLPSLAAMLFSPLNFQFLAGCSAAALHSKFGLKYWRPSLAGGVAALVVLNAAYLMFQWPSRSVLHYSVSPGWWLDIAFGLVFALIVYGLAGASVAGRGPGKLLILLGSSSYAIYLTHTIIMPVMARIAHGHVLLGSLWGQLLLSAGAACGGLMLFLFFERPLVRLISVVRRPKTIVKLTDEINRPQPGCAP